MFSSIIRLALTYVILSELGDTFLKVTVDLRVVGLLFHDVLEIDVSLDKIFLLEVRFSSSVVGLQILAVELEGSIAVLEKKKIFFILVTIIWRKEG